MASKSKRKETTEAQAASVRRRVGDASESQRPLEEEIRARAYEIYVERGGLPGDEVEDWLRAERELDQIYRFKHSRRASSDEI